MGNRLTGAGDVPAGLFPQLIAAAEAGCADDPASIVEQVVGCLSGSGYALVKAGEVPPWMKPSAAWFYGDRSAGSLIQWEPDLSDDHVVLYEVYADIARHNAEPVDATVAADEQTIIRDILEALCERDGLPVDSAVEPGHPAHNYELAQRLRIGHVFGMVDQL